MKKEKPTLQETLVARQLRQPPAVIYPLLANIWKLLFFKKLGVTVSYKADVKRMKGPFIVVSNHASRMDYIYTGIALLPHRLNYVAGYNEFFRSHLAAIFRLLQVIPKRNFVPDIYAVREIARILKSGGKIMLFPEGMSSISGANQPCAVGSGKLLKHFQVPVLMTKIAGGYLTSTKYCLDERPGRVEVEVDILFTPEQLAAMSAEEIQKKLDEALYQDDYAWTKEKKNAYRGNGRLAHNMHTLLYRCPRCGVEFQMRGEGNVLRCMACGNGATLNEYYELIPLDESCVLPISPRAWLDEQRAHVRNELLQENFLMRERVRVGVLPARTYLKAQATSEIAGEGELTLTRAGFHYRGTLRGEDFSFDIPPENLPTFGMCTDVSRFYTFLDAEFLEFFPENETTEKWMLAVEENHRLAGGKWQVLYTQKEA
ncbi:1-acyl-sn-glycerol-3-phosphate acyltransferase [Christensenellaceae bacterium OttesenSCG-928-L17]|nr:1-acyl-sn-glycerol-3-phosphate acyltransferase [Christensenellaceae bacterium OttesenSCG-928-L17]